MSWCWEYVALLNSSSDTACHWIVWHTHTHTVSTIYNSTSTRLFSPPNQKIKTLFIVVSADEERVRVARACKNIYIFFSKRDNRRQASFIYIYFLIIYFITFFALCQNHSSREVLCRRVTQLLVFVLSRVATILSIFILLPSNRKDLESFVQQQKNVFFFNFVFVRGTKK